MAQPFAVEARRSGDELGKDVVRMLVAVAGQRRQRLHLPDGGQPAPHRRSRRAAPALDRRTRGADPTAAAARSAGRGGGRANPTRSISACSRAMRRDGGCPRRRARPAARPDAPTEAFRFEPAEHARQQPEIVGAPRPRRGRSRRSARGSATRPPRRWRRASGHRARRAASASAPSWQHAELRREPDEQAERGERAGRGERPDPRGERRTSRAAPAVRPTPRAPRRARPCGHPRPAPPGLRAGRCAGRVRRPPPWRAATAAGSPAPSTRPPASPRRSGCARRSATRRATPARTDRDRRAYKCSSSRNRSPVSPPVPAHRPSSRASARS